MGKKWDYDVPQIEVWQECLRVLKPGGHALIACGTRTQHRMAVNLEDAGFEIRDLIFWHFGSGFPKSHNIEKSLKKEYAKRFNKVEGSGVSNLQEEISKKKDIYKDNEAELLQLQVQRDRESKESNKILSKRIGEEMPSEGDEDGKESSVERWSNLLEKEGKLQINKVCEMSKEVSGDGKEGQLHNGTQIDNGATSGENIEESGGNTSHQPRPTGQQDRESNVISEQQFAQTIRRNRGFGTALKPSTEIWTLCRKPLEEKTIASNVLKHGTGGINIDKSRVPTQDNLNGGEFSKKSDKRNATSFSIPQGNGEYKQPTGRFPSNIILDGSDEVVEGFPEDTQRFFYTAKASKAERNKGCEELENKNNHSTVKPLKLMRYLIRLITPKDGICLDPYMGSGSTGIGAKLEGFNFIGIEREEEYCKIAEARINAYNNLDI